MGHPPATFMRSLESEKRNADPFRRDDKVAVTAAQADICRIVSSANLTSRGTPDSIGCLHP